MICKKSIEPREYAPRKSAQIRKIVGLLGTNPPASVTAAGVALPNVFTPDSLAASAVNAYYYNASIKTTFQKIFDNSPDITMEVTL